MCFKCLQWTDVHISFCFQRSWLQLSPKIQGEVNTWCLAGENIHCVGCLWKAASKWAWILVLFAFSKIEFFLKKRLPFQYRMFLCVSTVLLLWKLFQVQKEPYLVQEKNPRISREQNTCPWEVKQVQVLDLILLSWRWMPRSQHGKGNGSVTVFFEGGLWLSIFSPERKRLSLFCYFPARFSGELVNFEISTVVKCVFLQYSPTLDRAQHRILP